MISYFQAVVLGLLQGFSELFPISSLGHSVVLPKLLGWNIQQSDKFFLNFLVATHLATALVLLGFFWRDWLRIVQGIGRSLRDREIRSDDSDAKLGWLIVVATIPAGLLGLLLGDADRGDLGIGERHAGQDPQVEGLAGAVQRVAGGHLSHQGRHVGEERSSYDVAGSPGPGLAGTQLGVHGHALRRPIDAGRVQAERFPVQRPAGSHQDLVRFDPLAAPEMEAPR